MDNLSRPTENFEREGIPFDPNDFDLIQDRYEFEYLYRNDDPDLKSDD